MRISGVCSALTFCTVYGEHDGIFLCRVAQMKKLSKIIPVVVEPACRKHGILQYKIVTEWNDIIGHELSNMCVPIQLKFPKGKQNCGVLTVGVSNPGHIVRLQLSQDTLLKRLATYFGYHAVNRIKFVYAKEAK